MRCWKLVRLGSIVTTTTTSLQQPSYSFGLDHRCNTSRINHSRHCRFRRISSSSMSSSISSTSSTTTLSKPTKTLAVDPFCFRQFAEHASSKSYSGTVFSISIADFEAIVNERYNNRLKEQQQQQRQQGDEATTAATTAAILQEGYAPFCKHLFLINDFTTAQVNVLPITALNEQYLRTKYEARTEQELPVLTRYFPAHLLVTTEEHATLPVAKYLDLILYSREQINKESQAMKKVSLDDDDDVGETAPWGIVSIKAQDVDYELPMTPITMMRNALGKEEGGSGVPLDREAYLASVRYWKDHATVV